MNHLRLKSALDKYSAKLYSSPDELKSDLYADDKQYSADEIAEIISNITPPSNSTGFKLTERKPSPNDNLSLDQFDYNKFGDMSTNELNEPVIDPNSKRSFAEYIKLVNGLNGFENRDFVQYMASGVFQRVMNANMEPVFVLVGLKINKAEPVNHTRIPVSAARNLNVQIVDRNNPPSNSRYYLLKKSA